MRIKIIRATTVSMSLNAFCKGMLRELSERYDVVAISSPDEEFAGKGPRLADTDGEDVQERETYDGSFDDAQGRSCMHDGSLADARAGAGPHVYGVGVSDVNGHQAPNPDADGRIDLLLCHSCHSRGRGGEGRFAELWHHT